MSNMFNTNFDEFAFDPFGIIKRKEERLKDLQKTTDDADVDAQYEQIKKWVDEDLG